MNLVNAVTSGSIGNISRIDVTFHKKAINGSVMEFFLLITLTVVHRRQPRLLWPSAPAKEGTRYSLNLVVSGHKQLWSPPAANRLPMWLRNNASTGHSFNCSKWDSLPKRRLGRLWVGGKVAAAARDRVCSRAADRPRWDTRAGGSCLSGLPATFTLNILETNKGAFKNHITHREGGWLREWELSDMGGLHDEWYHSE